ncbi:MAG: PepSY domain-containing protein, partial [Rhodospirillales bacterium]|nr:PepSY domain-containing protein [Rhodospirillales bacterium]
MEPTFRASMNWLHTWAGVVLGGLLFAIFWMGTLAVFDREIDRWMAPMTRLALPAETAISIDALRPSYETAAAAKSAFWGVLFPTERVPAIRVSWREGSDFVQRFIDPATGATLPDGGTLAGTRFLYPFHYMLHIRFERIGYWIVGLAAMAMMALCVSGVVVHRKIFTDFFTFRVTKKPRRLVLDLHNVTGVLGLPFHFLITLSGLIIFFSIYFASAWQVAYNGDRQAFFADAYSTIRPEKAGRPGDMASLDAMTAEARRLWDGGQLRYLTVRNPGDARSVVQIGRLDEGNVSFTYDVAYFDGPTGKLISHRAGTPPVMSSMRFIGGLHLIQFRHWSLRWLYFGLGLAGCVMIATGYLFWLESRRKK